MWKEYKLKKLQSYKEAKARGEVDNDIIPLLDVINERSEFVTLSSCSGRIAVLDLQNFGDKLGAEFLGKWHDHADYSEIKKAAQKSRKFAWLILYPPILHIACRDLEAAKKLLNVANNAGFRRSGLISLKNLVVEISSLERLELPIAKNGELLVSDKYLELVTEIANEKLRSGKVKLAKLFELIKSFSKEEPL